MQPYLWSWWSPYRLSIAPTRYITSTHWHGGLTLCAMRWVHVSSHSNLLRGHILTAPIVIASRFRNVPLSNVSRKYGPSIRLQPSRGQLVWHGVRFSVSLLSLFLLLLFPLPFSCRPLGPILLYYYLSHKTFLSRLRTLARQDVAAILNEPK